MNSAKALDHPIVWPSQFSNVTADSQTLGWTGMQAFACDFHTSNRPLCVPSSADYLTLEINTDRPTAVSYQFGERESANTNWQPGDIWIYPNSESSRWTWDGPVSTVVFFLPMDRLKQLIIEGSDATCRHPTLVPGVSRDDGKLRNLLHMIADELVDEFSNGPQYIGSLVDATLIHLAKNYVTESDSGAEDRYILSSLQLTKIRRFVSDNIDTPIGVADLAEIAGVKLFEFPRAFRATTGVTPYQFILRERIEWSEELLKTTDLSLAEVSFIAGFSSQSHFTRTFRKQKSVTPQAYRHAFS